MKSVFARVESAVRKHRLLEPGQTVGVAVSGGADSTALLHLLHALAGAWGWKLAVLHVNYRVRGEESDADEQFVREFAAELGWDVLVENPVLAAGNFEQAARDARYSWFRRLIAAGVCDRVATGHTLSDQAETVLLRFLRGAGTSGLAGIRPSLPEGIVRPLLSISRREIRDWLCFAKLGWREDSSNQDTRFRRNRLRHELLPELTSNWNPAITRTLAQTADWAQAEEEYWDAEIIRLARDCLSLEIDAATLDASALAALPLAAARRLVRFAISHVRGDLRRIDFLHVEQILQLAAASRGHGHVKLPGFVARRSFNWLRLDKPLPPVPFRHFLVVPAEFPLPNSGPVIQLELKKADSVYNVGGHQLDWGLVSGSLELRNWRPGDHYIPAGHTSNIKLKHLFQKSRIPFWDRRQWPVIARADSILWTRRFGVAAGFLPSSRSREVLVIREIPPDPGERSNQNVSF